MLTTWGGYCSFLVVCAFIRCYRYYFQLLVYSDPEEGTRMVEIATVRRTVAFPGAHTGESGGPENCPADSTGSDPADPRSFPGSPRGRPGWPGSNRFKYRPPPRDDQLRQLLLQPAQLAPGQTLHKDRALHRTKALLESLRALAIRCRTQSRRAGKEHRRGVSCCLTLRK